VSLLKAGVKNPGLRDDNKWYEQEYDLLKRIAKQPTAVGTLVDLLSYDLGTAGSEDLQCLLLVKAETNKARVLTAVRNAKNDCEVKHAQDGICNPGEIWLSNLRTIAALVSRDERCLDE